MPPGSGRDTQTTVQLRTVVAFSTTQGSFESSADLEKRVKEIANRIQDKEKRASSIEESLFEIRDKVHGTA